LVLCPNGKLSSSSSGHCRQQLAPLFFIRLKEYLNIQYYLFIKLFAQKCKAKVNKTDFTTIRVAIKGDYDKEDKTESNQKGYKSITIYIQLFFIFYYLIVQTMFN